MAHELKIIKVVMPGSYEAFSRHLYVVLAGLILKMLHKPISHPECWSRTQEAPAKLGFGALDCGKGEGPRGPPAGTEHFSI